MSDVVYQCQAAAAGFIAGPDRAAVKRDVDRLVGVAGDVEADALSQIQGDQLNLPRPFGAAPTAALDAFRQVVPWQMDPTQRPNVPPGQLAYSFLVGNPASLFFPPAASDPATAARARFKGAGYRARTRAAVRHAKSRATRVAKTAKAHRAFLVRQGKQK